MNKEKFEQLIVTPLESWVHLGEKISDAGTRLIGHVPHIAPKAYMHLIYTGLTNHEVISLEANLGRQLPKTLNSFYKHANGIDIFSGAIFLQGYVPHKRKYEVNPDNYPANIVIDNTSARIKGMSDGAIVIASYKWDSSVVIIEEEDSVTRYDVHGTGHPMQKWPDFDTWITSEIAYFSQFFDEEGKMKGDGKEVFAPH